MCLKLGGQKPVRRWSFRSKSFCSFFLTKQIYLYTLSEVHFADKGKKRKKSNNTTLFLFGPFLVDEIIWGSIFFCAQKNVKILFASDKLTSGGRSTDGIWCCVDIFMCDILNMVGRQTFNLMKSGKRNKFAIVFCTYFFRGNFDEELFINYVIYI